MLVARVLFLISVSVGMAMVALWESKEVVRVGYEITALEKKKDYWGEKNLELGTEISSLRSPRKILGKLADMGIELLPPEGNRSNSTGMVSTSRITNGR